MTEEKLQEITKSLKGISQKDWIKLKSVVDSYFNKEKSQLERQIQLADMNYVVNEFKSLCPISFPQRFE